MQNTSKELTFSTWNPVTGCSKISPGCAHCYAERIALRLRDQGQRRYANGFRVTLHPEALREPLHWRKPRMILTCSMSDLFHKDVPLTFIRQVFAVMAHAEQHTFMALTKRARRMAECAPHLPTNTQQWPRNVWAGVTVDTREHIERIEHLKSSPAPVKFVTFEPLLEYIPEIDLDGIDWIIVGGETGHKARPMNADWVRSLRDMANEQGVPFLFKQWGGGPATSGGRTLDGRIWNERPEITSREQLSLFGT
jgi:protein gp37